MLFVWKPSSQFGSCLLPLKELCLKTLNEKRKMHTTSDFRFPLPLDQSLSFLGVDGIFLRGSSNGFLLSSVEDVRPMNYTICNPVTKEFFALPPPIIPCRWLNHGFFCHATYQKVVRFSQHAVPGFSTEGLAIEIYSSKSPKQWKLLPLMTFPFSFILLQFPAIITEKEVIYLPITLGNQTKALLIFDPTDKDCMEVLEFPAPSETRIVFKCESFGQVDGLIHFARYESGEIKIWELNEPSDGARKRCLKHKGGLNMTRRKCPYNEGFYFIGFHPWKSQVLFIGTEHNMFVYDVGRTELEIVCNFAEWNLKSVYIYFPYSYSVIGHRMFYDR